MITEYYILKKIFKEFIIARFDHHAPITQRNYSISFYVAEKRVKIIYSQSHVSQFGYALWYYKVMSTLVTIGVLCYITLLYIKITILKSKNTNINNSYIVN
jgi:hypothetical protein